MIYKSFTANTSQRIDQFLSEKFTKFSRSNLQRKIRSGYVKVNSKITKKSGFYLKDGDKVEIAIVKENVSPQRIESSKIMKFEVLYEDKNLLVINKPSGISVHRGAGEPGRITVLDSLKPQYDKANEKGNSVQMNLIHRLDKDTSGVLLIAKNEETHWTISRQFELREVEKYYAAIVSGDFLKRRGKEELLTGYITRNSKDRKKMMLTDKSKGRFVSSKVFFIGKYKSDKFGIISLLLIKLNTGRTHQIRVQLSSIGFPIVGDKIYGGRELGQLLLHSYRIRIHLPDSSEMEFRAPLPLDFNKIFPLIKYLHAISNFPFE